jgi:Ca-activated chloride channel family protein
MLAQDVSPDRLERAKLLIASIVDENIGNKVGVIVFSGTAMWQCPVTYDLEAVKMFVQNVTTEQLPVGGTQISDAIILATKPLADTESAVNRVMVLISDGEDHDSRMSEAISQANKYHLKVLTVGVGTSDGATIPQPNGPLKDAQGVTVVSKLNPSLLKVIADETGGQYFDITDRGATANLIRAIAAVEKAGSAENPENRSRDDQFQIFQLIGILAFLLDMLVPVANKINYEKN